MRTETNLIRIDVLWRIERAQGTILEGNKLAKRFQHPPHIAFPSDFKQKQQVHSVAPGDSNPPYSGDTVRNLSKPVILRCGWKKSVTMERRVGEGELLGPTLMGWMLGRMGY